jgi:dihydrofolate reductase
MNLTLIAALDENNLIGNEGKLPWKIKGDLARFKQKTIGHPLIMGRKTYESIGRPLPERTNIVLSSQEIQREGIIVCKEIGEALRHAQDHLLEDEIVYVIGGASVYEETLPLADQLDITRIQGTYQGDTYFPKINEEDWNGIETSHLSLPGQPTLTFLTYQRK